MSSSIPALPPLSEDRQPLQSRSRASLTRMLAAARRLLIERGSADFALSDVSRVGRVSIGSIYHRFQSKEELLRAVHRQLMKDLDAEQSAMVDAVCGIAQDLPGMLAMLIDSTAEFLRRNAGALRPMMACADKDNAIATAGKASLQALNDLFVAALLTQRHAIQNPEPERAAGFCFKIIYGAIARDLGFEAAHIAADPADWNDLKKSLFSICAAFLMSPSQLDFGKALRSSTRVKAAPRMPAAKRRQPISATSAQRREGALKAI